jgi:hypothetical protein
VNKQREIAKLEAEISSAIEAAVPLLDAASAAAHRIEQATDEDDPEQAHYDRLIDLGMLTDCAARMCGPNLRILTRVVLTLLNDEHDADEIEHEHLHH